LGRVYPTISVYSYPIYRENFTGGVGHALVPDPLTLYALVSPGPVWGTVICWTFGHLVRKRKGTQNVYFLPADLLLAIDNSSHTKLSL